ncbi:MAG: carboxypeptidase-like regulatory domain-containing protein [Phaeodactylibacter sp.]|nr:carboxypeptidase-like regulatory domain-containing protein [Phaeodactylibacter sp.]MCB9266556.1 carboxypeptidase-like regulatory domain-containing protein [Lewinellaceae bacterium]MCB9288038.1 carboxypeptidase-like regulatory domain-containing protein [Lewinellaceae bacterium]
MASRTALITTLFFCILSTSLTAGGVSGKVTDASGAPLAFATIFVRETGSGTTTNEEGYYEIRLNPGTYTLVFQFLGYKTESREVRVGQRMEVINVSLQEQPLQLQEVIVQSNGKEEDPAYSIMRKAIAKASYHQQQLDSYEATVYIKGSGRLKDSPFFLRNTMKKEGIDSTVAFTSESVSRIEYQRPNTFKETVISIYTRGEGNDTEPNGYINGSFYEPKIAEAISPLSPQAFGYYKFRYEGFFMDRGYGVNKIRVIPRSRGEDVFEGVIYIVEDWWSIYSLRLKTYKLGFGVEVYQMYAPIEDKAWLPVSHKFNVEGKILGFEFEYNYLATVSDYKIELNPDLEADFKLIDEKLNKELAAELERARAEGDDKSAEIKEKLASGEELTRKQLRQLMREYEKEEQKAQEEPEVVMNTSIVVDSMARQRDSAYWEAIRPVPLTKQEVKGYERLDSLAVVEAEKEAADSLESVGRHKKRGGFSPLDIIGGSNYKVGEKQYIAHGSLWDRFFFNPVEGFNIHTNLSYSINKDNRFAFTVTPRYAFARRKLTGKGQFSYTYGPQEERNNFSLEGGRYIYQYNPQEPISNLFNTYLNLVEERNYISLYEKDYLKLSHSNRLRENITLNFSAEWANRYALENTTTQSWFPREGRIYGPNIPFNEELEGEAPETEKAFVLGFSAVARPWQKYRIRNQEKEPIENSSPELRLAYRQGLKNIAESVTDYSYLEVGFQHKIRPGVRGIMDIKVEAGMFLNKNYAGFADYHHFMGNRILLVTADPVGSFRLLPYYQYSTMDKFAAAHVHYQFRKLLFTQIPEVWLLGIKENVFVNYLATPTSDNYTEVGYSIDNIFRFLRVEAAVAFQDGKYKDWGILIGIASNIGGNFSIR